LGQLFVGIGTALAGFFKQFTQAIANILYVACILLFIFKCATGSEDVVRILGSLGSLRSSITAGLSSAENYFKAGVEAHSKLRKLGKLEKMTNRFNLIS